MFVKLHHASKIFNMRHCRCRKTAGFLRSIWHSLQTLLTLLPSFSPTTIFSSPKLTPPQNWPWIRKHAYKARNWHSRLCYSRAMTKRGNDDGIYFWSTCLFNCQHQQFKHTRTTGKILFLVLVSRSSAMENWNLEQQRGTNHGFHRKFRSNRLQPLADRWKEIMTNFGCRNSFDMITS